MIRTLTKKKDKNIACRVSDRGGGELALKKKLKWIWFDRPYKKSYKTLKKLKNYNFKICIVSPDLHKKKIKFNQNEINYLKKVYLLMQSV